MRYYDPQDLDGLDGFQENLSGGRSVVPPVVQAILSCRSKKSSPPRGHKKKRDAVDYRKLAFLLHHGLSIPFRDIGKLLDIDPGYALRSSSSIEEELRESLVEADYRGVSD